MSEKYTDLLVGEHDMAMQEEWEEVVFQRRHRCCSNTYKVLFYTLLSFNIILAPFFILDQPTKSIRHVKQLTKHILERRAEPTEVAQPQHLLRQTDMFEGIGKKVVTFNEDKKFWGEPSDQGSPWNDLQPRGTGHILVWDAANWNLTGGFPMNWGLSEEYTMTVFHQLHCLAMIKTELQRQTLRYPNPEHTHENEDHIPHCFDYIRQGLMCAGDMTLEKAKTNKDGIKIRDVNGWEVEHECKDWEGLMKWSEEHRSDNTKRIVPDWFALDAGFKHFEDQAPLTIVGGQGNAPSSPPAQKGPEQESHTGSVQGHGT